MIEIALGSGLVPRDRAEHADIRRAVPSSDLSDGTTMLTDKLIHLHERASLTDNDAAR